MGGTGKRLGEVANGVTLADGTSSITIRLGLLHRALRDEAVSRGIRIEHGKRLVDATDGSGVAARFENGTEITGDMLVGADGLNSHVRRIIDPDAPRPNYTGLLSMGGCARVTTLAPTPETFHMIFGKHAFFGYCVIGRWFRDLFMPFALKHFASPAAHAWLYRYHVEWNEPVCCLGSAG